MDGKRTAIFNQTAIGLIVVGVFQRTKFVDKVGATVLCRSDKRQKQQQKEGGAMRDTSHHQRISAEPQVNPEPKAARQTRSPSLILPASQASHSAMGTDAAVVLP